MAHDNDGLIEVHNPMVMVPLVIPMGVAARWAHQPQFVISDRMYKNLDSILTADQKAALEAAGVEFQPVVFPQQAAVL
jgi:hypothetical protein